MFSLFKFIELYIDTEYAFPNDDQSNLNDQITQFNDDGCSLAFSESQQYVDGEVDETHAREYEVYLGYPIGLCGHPQTAGDGSPEDGEREWPKQ